ncbi:hypothetical protein BS47DRAFT_1368699 [Hydnum rufescens UP504]|uniref:Uncharacterized protein n=1 Tax=Hydnum rufescens UP504 TaxID=1448309 RepID=A0A9P6AF45_9AGAM|nr:hypothetical protein BS47DRAFT_1368699 [Hydnum rufescens UP504]
MWHQHLSAFGDPGIAGVELCLPANAYTDRLERQVDNHTAAAVWSKGHGQVPGTKRDPPNDETDRRAKRPQIKWRQTTPSEMHHDTEVATRRLSGCTGHMNHTPATAGVWFYIRLARPVVPGPPNDNPPAKRDPNPTPAIAGYRFNHPKPATPPTEIITHPPNESRERDVPKNIRPDPREWERTTQDGRDPRRATHPPKQTRDPAEQPCKNGDPKRNPRMGKHDTGHKPWTNPTPALAGVII